MYNPSFDEATSFVIMMTEAYWEPNMGLRYGSESSPIKDGRGVYEQPKPSWDSWLAQGIRPLRPLQRRDRQELTQLQRAGAPIKVGIPRKQPLLTPGGSGCCVFGLHRGQPTSRYAAKLFIKLVLVPRGANRKYMLSRHCSTGRHCDQTLRPVSAETRHIPNPNVQYAFPAAAVPDSPPGRGGGGRYEPFDKSAWSRDRAGGSTMSVLSRYSSSMDEGFEAQELFLALHWIVLLCVSEACRCSAGIALVIFPDS